MKSKYGAGYNVQVKVKSDSNGQPETTQVQGFMRLHFPEAKLEVISFLLFISNVVYFLLTIFDFDK